MGGNEIYNVCRLCLSENNKFFDIFESKGTQGWIAADIIMELLRLQVSSGDRYPHCVCSECLGKLEDFKLFKQRCKSNKKLLDRAYAAKHGIPPSEELDARIYVHYSKQSEQDEDVEIPIEKDPLDLDVKENIIKTEVGDCSNQCNATSSAEMIELMNQGVNDHFENSEHIIKEEVLDIQAQSDSEDLYVKEDELMISGNELAASTGNNSIVIPQKTERCSYSGDNVLVAHSSGPSSDIQANTYGVSYSSWIKCIVGNNEEFTESVYSSSNTELISCICDVCNERFTSVEDIAAHMSTHVSEYSYHCGQCNKGFHIEDALTKHKCNSGVKSAKLLMCNWCNKGFNRLSHRKSHERVHTGERPYSCTKCPKRFKNIGDLYRHIKVHTGERPYKCTLCPKAFPFQGYLNKHMKAHSSNAQYKCKECPKAFYYRSNLNSHMKIHSVDKSLQFSECSKKLHFKSARKTHIVKHRGRKQFSCRECGKKFSLKRNLTKHMKTHSGGSRVKGNKCSKSSVL